MDEAGLKRAEILINAPDFLVDFLEENVEFVDFLSTHPEVFDLVKAAGSMKMAVHLVQGMAAIEGVTLRPSGGSAGNSPSLAAVEVVPVVASVQTTQLTSIMVVTEVMEGSLQQVSGTKRRGPEEVVPFGGCTGGFY